MDQTPWLDELALAVADGRPIDWLAQNARLAADIDPGLIAPLRLVERVVRAHRETTFDIELEEMSVRIPAGDVQNLPEDPDDAAVTWGPLTIADRIGGGSYGDVYKAHDRRLDRTVALKLLRRRDSAQTRRASAVIEEGRLMARVRHPNVVMVYGAERIDGRVGLWMEYLEGQTLAEELRLGPFTERAIVEVARAMCGALAAVHAAGLLHHDLKAQNVIRTTDGRIVLTDFGAGRQVITDGPGPENRQMRGTPAYLAPEILAGRPASLQSEVYSLGVLLHYLATGVFPDRTSSPDEIQAPLIQDAGLSPALSALIGRCLAPDPAHRFAAMPDVAAALTPMTATNTRTSRFVRRLRTHAWLWLIPTVLGFAVASVWSATTPDRYRSSGLISIVPPKVPAAYVPMSAASAQTLPERIPAIRNEILSRTRLERIIQDLDLYADERREGIMEEVVEHMRSDISVTAHSGAPAITVGFTADNPRTAKVVVERLVALFIDESTRDRKLMLEGTDQFLESSLKDVKARLESSEAKLHQARMAGGSPTTADTLEFEVARESYRQLLTRKQEVETAANLERREIGEQFKLIDPPTIPGNPIGPPRAWVKGVSALAGWLLGLVFVAVSSSRPRDQPPAPAVEPTVT